MGFANCAWGQLDISKATNVRNRCFVPQGWGMLETGSKTASANLRGQEKKPSRPWPCRPRGVFQLKIRQSHVRLWRALCGDMAEGRLALFAAVFHRAPQVAFSEAIWCTNSGAARWLRETGLALNDQGFIEVRLG